MQQRTEPLPPQDVILALANGSASGMIRQASFARFVNELSSEWLPFTRPPRDGKGWVSTTDCSPQGPSL